MEEIPHLNPFQILHADPTLSQNAFQVEEPRTERESDGLPHSHAPERATRSEQSEQNGCLQRAPPSLVQPGDAGPFESISNRRSSRRLV